MFVAQDVNPGTSGISGHPFRSAAKGGGTESIIFPKVNTLGYTYFAPLGLFSDNR